MVLGTNPTHLISVCQVWISGTAALDDEVIKMNPRIMSNVITLTQ